MTQLPRLAIGTIQAEADSRFLVWALLHLFVRRSLQPQHFHSRCCFFGVNGAQVASGEGSRHLDSWTMSAPLAQELFLRAARNSDLAVIEGRFDAALGNGHQVEERHAGGSLDQLCEWLGLPRLALIDVGDMQAHGLPPRPTADAVMLDRISGGDELRRIARQIQDAWGLPVLGGLPELPRIRETIRSTPADAELPLPLCAALCDALERYAKVPELLRLAGTGSWPASDASSDWEDARRVFESQPVTVAVAYDKIFHCHFLDTLDMLELLGATVVDFSPLHDDCLPEGTDLVYLGCGRPDLYQAQLADNVCMRMALLRHICEGRRVYAEGGGLAFLAEFLFTAEQQLAMAGLVPVCVRADQPQQPLRAVELQLAQDTWLGESGLTLRGYQNPNLHFEPTGEVAQVCGGPVDECNLLAHKQVIGSRVHLNFAAQPRALCSLVTPRKCSMARRS
ncbi:MAG: hypothetical protein JSS27_00280 [Planctomycetes bacterium]|nr:hypothetical protein [Planctomycetota bacterium]